MSSVSKSRGHLNPSLPKPLIDNYEWQERGKCHGIDNPEIFFLPYGARMAEKRRLEKAAKDFCVGCPVISECLSYALQTNEQFGVWGGLTPEERNRLARRTRIV